MPVLIYFEFLKLLQYLRWLITVIFRTSARGIKLSLKGLRDSARDLKFAKLTAIMAGRGLHSNTLFPPSLVNCLRNEYCDIDVEVAIDRAAPAISLNNSRKKQLFQFSSFFLLGQTHFWVFLDLLGIVFFYRLCC